MMFRVLVCISLVFFFNYATCSSDLNGDASNDDQERMRYLLYDVNPGEGFNLRRDVYMRMANMVKMLNEREPWTLVLPPWGRIYHWKSRWLDQSKIRWSHFFDLASLNRHVPVVEFEDFFRHFKEPDSALEIDDAVYLQRYEEGWRDGKWETRADFRPCLDKQQFAKDMMGLCLQDEAGRWRWWFWGYHDDVIANQFRCLSVQMEYSDFVPLLQNNITSDSVLVLRAETLSHGRYSNWSPEYWTEGKLHGKNRKICYSPKASSIVFNRVFLYRAEQFMHGSYSDWSPEWWTARRSMRFAKHLRDIADEFRETYLDSTDEKDNTILDPDWTKMKRKHGEAHGGPYVAAHLRRQDFARAHSKDVPSIENTAKQLAEILTAQQLDTVFIATDGTKEELEELKSHLKEFKVIKFEATEDQHSELMDGGIAVIDQLICAHASYFIGTSVSTFTFRIHEEREILGFAQEMTYNRLCGDDQGRDCDQPAKWECKYQ